ncbi:hypothetical protein QTO34_005127, partial [Cnephaeus nilssonii]
MKEGLQPKYKSYNPPKDPHSGEAIDIAQPSLDIMAFTLERSPTNAMCSKAFNQSSCLSIREFYWCDTHQCSVWEGLQ